MATRIDDLVAEEEWGKPEFQKEVGDLIARYRISQNISQSELGRLMSCSQREIAYLESGQRMPRLITLSRLCQALGAEMNLHICPTGKVYMVRR